MNLKRQIMKKTVLGLMALMLMISGVVFSTSTAHAEGWLQDYPIDLNLGAAVIDSIKETDYHGAIEGAGGNDLYYWKIYEFTMDQEGLLDVYLESEDPAYFDTKFAYDGFAIFDAEDPDSLIWRSCKSNYKLQKQFSSARAIYYGSAKILLKEGNYYFAIRQHNTSTSSYYLTLNYEKPVINVTSIAFKRAKYSIKDDGKVTLKPIILPNNATDMTLEWSSSETDVATVNDKGVVVGVSPGETTITATSADGEISAECEVTVTCNHKYRTTITCATTKKNGRKQVRCSKCGDKTVTKIFSIQDVRLSKTSYVRNGKRRKPSVIAKNSEGKSLKSGRDYTVTYPKGTENVGQYTVEIKFKGNYAGTVKKKFTVVPKATSIKQVKPRKNAFTVTWRKQAAQSSGYEIAYSTSSSFSKASTVTMTIDRNTKVSSKISNLQKGKLYYVKVRVYTKVDVNRKEKVLYSDWSKIKGVVAK